MKKQIFSIILLSVVLFSCGGEVARKETLGADFIEMKLTTVYKSKNIYVRNSYSKIGGGWCVKDVFVNGTPTKMDNRVETFEIDLVSIGIEEGDSVSIIIIHANDCRPEVLNI